MPKPLSKWTDMEVVEELHAVSKLLARPETRGVPTLKRRKRVMLGELVRRRGVDEAKRIAGTID
jgi:hypothetical protein